MVLQVVANWKVKLGGDSNIAENVRGPNARELENLGGADSTAPDSQWEPQANRLLSSREDHLAVGLNRVARVAFASLESYSRSDHIAAGI